MEPGPHVLYSHPNDVESLKIETGWHIAWDSYFEKALQNLYFHLAKPSTSPSTVIPAKAGIYWGAKRLYLLRFPIKPGMM